MRAFLSLSTCVAVLVCHGALAEGPRVVGPLPGYKCMMLNITGEQAMDPSTRIAFYSAPSDASPVAGFATLQVAVREPRHEVNGFVEARFPTGGEVWIKGNMIAPYHSLGDSTAKCVPVMMSNGRAGFDYPHSY